MFIPGDLCPLPPLGFHGILEWMSWRILVRCWNCQTFRGGFGNMGHVGSYWGYWDVGTLHMGSEEGIVFLLKSRIKMGEESDVSILFHFGTSGCIQVKEWGKKKIIPTLQAHKGWSLFLFLSLFPVSCRSSSLLVLTPLSGLAELKNHLAATFMPGLKIISNWKVFRNCCNNLGYLALSRVYIWFI